MPNDNMIWWFIQSIVSDLKLKMSKTWVRRRDLSFSEEKKFGLLSSTLSLAYFQAWLKIGALLSGCMSMRKVLFYSLKISTSNDSNKTKRLITLQKQMLILFKWKSDICIFSSGAFWSDLIKIIWICCCMLKHIQNCNLFHTFKRNEKLNFQKIQISVVWFANENGGWKRFAGKRPYSVKDHTFLSLFLGIIVPG